MMKFPFSFFCLLLAIGLSAQCSSKSQKFITKAKTIQFTDSDQAVVYLQKAIKSCPESEEGAFLLADIYRNQKNYLGVIKILEQYLQYNGGKNPKVYYFLADAQKSLMLYAEAVNNFETYLSANTSSRKLNFAAKENSDHCRFALKAYQNIIPTEFIPLSSSINSDQSEYLPIMTADETKMVFTRRDRVAEEALFSERMPMDGWSEPQTLAGLPDPYRKAAVSMSVEGNMLVFAMADHPRGFGNFDLYYVEYTNGRWSRPQNFGQQVNTAGWESQPCISADGRTVYFSSDRKGGEGGNDIWKTKRQPDGSWSKPTNLGVEINGPKNEESPFIHRDQRTLYFRSDGHPGLGSFDIFMSRLIRFKKWTQPLNLGYPVNTIGNDGSLFVSMGGEQAFIASDVDHRQWKDYKNQVRKKHTDIYEFLLHESFQPISTTYTRIQFVDGLTNQVIQPFVELSDNTSGDTLFFGAPDTKGEVLICIPMQSTYALTASLDNYIPYFERFEPEQDSWNLEPVHEIVKLFPVTPEDGHVFSPVILENVLFETNTAELRPESFPELNRLLNFLSANKETAILIRGHTDDIGEADYNMQLSMRRAKSVYDFLVNQGISSERLDYVGLGETEPIADNSTEQGRNRNRRTEFVVKK